MAVLAAAVVYAQSPDQPGAKELRDKNFSKAERKILKTYYADTTNAMSCYMMGLLYGDTLNPRHDNERAYEAMLQTRRIVGKLGNIKRALLRRNGLTTDTIDKHLARLTTQGFDAARRQNTKKAYDHFYDFYRATMPDSLRDLAHESASTIDYTAAEQENTIEAYEHFLAMHPESSKAYDAEQRMHTLAYERAKSINTLNAYERFLADYPDADEADEAELQIHTITYYRALSSGSEEAFRRYADTYPESPYAAAAKRKANALRFADETDATDWQSFKRYIEKHPDDTERVAQAKQIIAELSIETKNADGLVWSLHHCDSTMRDTIIRATHDLYVNSDHIAEFDAIYGRIAPEDIRERDRRALDAIMSVNTSDRNSVANALRATAPYRISYDMLLYMIELDASRGKWDYVNKTVEQFADQFESNADYEALRVGANLRPIGSHLWKFYRMRPSSFPTIRISQFADLVSQSKNLFDTMLQMTDVRDLQRLFNRQAAPYWNDHYRFDSPCARSSVKQVGTMQADMLIINAWVPLLFVFGAEHGQQQYKDQALALLGQMRAESNAVIRQWQAVGISPGKAAESQALDRKSTRLNSSH